MKLNEIILMTKDMEDPGIDMSSFTKGKKILGEIDNFQIVYKTSNQSREWKLITLETDNKPILFIVGNFLKHEIAMFQILRAFVEKEFRGKSLMRKLLQFLKSKLDITFISDRDLTPSGLDIWKRFKTDWKVSIFDTVTNKRIPWSDKTEQELFVPEVDYNRVRIDPNHPLNVKAQTYRLISEDKDIFNSGRMQFTILNEYLRCTWDLTKRI